MSETAASSASRPLDGPYIRYQQYNAEQWNAKRDLIANLYLEKRKTLHEVMGIMRDQHQFRPT